MLVAVALVTLMASYATMHYGVWQKFHGEGGMRHDLHTSRHKDHLWDGFHRASSHAPASCPPCDGACGGGQRRRGDDVRSEGGDGDGGDAEDAAAGAASSPVKKGAGGGGAAPFKNAWLTPGLAAEAKDLDTIALKEELRVAKERIGELTALLNIKCVVKDFTQCAGACAHRIMRHKQFLAQCHRTLQHRGCPDCSLQTARVLAKGEEQGWGMGGLGGGGLFFIRMLRVPHPLPPAISLARSLTQLFQKPRCSFAPASKIDSPCVASRTPSSPPPSKPRIRARRRRRRAGAAAASAGWGASTSSAR